MRAAIGLFAAVLLIAGVVTRNQVDDAVSGAFLRVGVMMAIWWFAYPQVQRVPRWLGIAGGVVLVLVVLRPKLLLLAIPILIVLWLLRPRKPRSRNPTRSSAQA
jgi:hypothetical protein